MAIYIDLDKSRRARLANLNDMLRTVMQYKLGQQELQQTQSEAAQRFRQWQAEQALREKELGLREKEFNAKTADVKSEIINALSKLKGKYKNWNEAWKAFKSSDDYSLYKYAYGDLFENFDKDMQSIFKDTFVAKQPKKTPALIQKYQKFRAGMMANPPIKPLTIKPAFMQGIENVNTLPGLVDFYRNRFYQWLDSRRTNP